MIAGNSASSNQKSVAINRYRIMMIDDEPDILEVCRKGLAVSYEVHGFSNPNGALVNFRANPSMYDLVITDIRMPQMSGFELALEIRKIRKDIPVLFMTAYEVIPVEYKDIFSAANPSQFIDKPFSLKTLTDLVSQFARK
jgi:DNA-binding NtrC family response regulator